MRPLRAAPATLPMLGAAAVMAWWAVDGDAFSVAVWGPGGLLLVGFLVLALLAVPVRLASVPRAVVVAAAALAAFTLWSFASVAWAADRGFAWEGAARTSLYLVAFCLFAFWPQRETTAAWVLGAVVAAVALAAGITALRLTGDAATSALLGTGRLKAPTGYPNATAALMLVGALPAVLLASSRRVPWWLRGLLVAAAVLECCLALLAVSRGAVYSMPIVLLVLFVAVPGRLRTLATLIPVVAAVAACARELVDVGDVVVAGGELSAAASRALGSVAVAAVVAGLLVAAVAFLEQRRPASPAVARRVRLGATAVVSVALLAGLAGGLAVVGSPADRVDSAWDSFKGGYEGNDSDRNRLVAGLGSNRYDFYRVALRTFQDHPLVGVGADGYYQEYLREGRSGETPRYPHSLELRTLSQTGVVGAALLLVALGAALVAAARGMRNGGGLQAAVGGGATIATVYWLVHGSLDWFWEWASLGVPAFALLGLACALAPRREPAVAGERREPSRARFALAGAAALLAVPLLSLWLADSASKRAADGFAAHPQASYRLLDRSAALNPFGSRPATLEGSIALRLGDLPRADAAFGRALERVPDDVYATLERGAVASARGDRARALTLLRRATVLAPRDRLAKEALAVVRDGGAIDVAELNRRILAAAQRLAS